MFYFNSPLEQFEIKTCSGWDTLLDFSRDDSFTTRLDEICLDIINKKVELRGMDAYEFLIYQGNQLTMKSFDEFLYDFFFGDPSIFAFIKYVVSYMLFHMSIYMPVIDLTFPNAMYMLFFVTVVGDVLIILLMKDNDIDDDNIKLAFVPASSIQVFFLVYYYVCVKILTANITSPNYRNLLFPFFFSIGLIILYSNLSGLISTSFAVTANFFIIFGIVGPLLLPLVGGVIRERKFTFLRNFFPFGAPTWLLPLIIPIEILSILMRPVSLILRLGCNILSGHCIMHVMGGSLLDLIISCETSDMDSNFLPFFLAIIFCFLLAFLTIAEFIICLIQVYIFLTILSICCNDIIGGHLPVMRKASINFWAQ